MTNTRLSDLQPGDLFTFPAGTPGAGADDGVYWVAEQRGPRTLIAYRPVGWAMFASPCISVGSDELVVRL